MALKAEENRSRGFKSVGVAEITFNTLYRYNVCSPAESKHVLGSAQATSFYPRNRERTRDSETR